MNKRDPYSDAAIAKVFERWPVLRLFVVAMGRKLDANAHKGGWTRDSALSLSTRVLVEAAELVVEAQLADHMHQPTRARLRRIMGEAVDAANMAMMVWDVTDDSLGRLEMDLKAAKARGRT